jgi:MFS transporter, DHA1 family, multidrug resistance protein
MAITSAGAARSATKRVPTGWRLLLVIGSLSIFGPLCLDMYLPSLPRISRDLHASTSAVQLTISACLVGIAVGQLVIGPISDRQGRRAPLLVGIAAFVGSSVGCIFVSNVLLLDVLRFSQGIGGAAGIVISRAIVRDLFEGATAARFFSTLMLVTGLGPIIAPQIGAELLRLGSWRGIFVALSIMGSVLFVTAVFNAPETLPPERRQAGGLRVTARSLATVASDRTFVGYALVSSLGFGTLLAYIAGASFVLQDIYHLSPQLFGLVFAMNAAGLVIGAQINGHLVHRVGSSTLLAVGLAIMVCGAGAFLAAVSTHWLGLGSVLPCLFAVLFSAGLINPNAMALAMQNHPNAAGVASALLGSGQFLLAAVVAPIVGLAGNHNALPMGFMMLGLAGLASIVRFAVAPRRSARIPASGGALPLVSGVTEHPG